MPFQREIRRLLFGFLAALGLMLLAAGYWAVVGADSLLLREDNPRTVEREERIQRGALWSADGVLLAYSRADANGRMQRHYPFPAAYSALGYASLRYGTGGIEAAYDALLRGDENSTPTDRFLRELVHQAQSGHDVRLSLHAATQAHARARFGDQAGALVLLDVNTGGILALLSQPHANPNTLDAHWERLTQDPGKPFFNRVLQGRYQAGGALQSAWVLAAILSGQSTTQRYPQATAPILLDDTTLTCAFTPPSEVLTLAEAYAYACPSPFVVLLQTNTPMPSVAALAGLDLGRAPLIPGYEALEANSEATPEATQTPDDSLLRSITGQGADGLNPLAMATLMAATLREGDAAQPWLLAASRAPNAAWQAIAPPSPPRPLMTSAAAAQMRALLRDNLSHLGLNAPSLGGHVAIAYSGEEQLTWFVGFSTADPEHPIALALVLEGQADPARALALGLRVLESPSHAAP